MNNLILKTIVLGRSCTPSIYYKKCFFIYLFLYHFSEAEKETYF
jgi:hypothetical protein